MKPSTKFLLIAGVALILTALAATMSPAQHIHTRSSGTSLPATCNVWDEFDNTSTGSLSLCSAPNTWFTLSGAAGTGTINSGTTNQLGYYAANGTTISGLNLGTNLSITSGTLNASGGSGSGAMVNITGTVTVSGCSVSSGACTVSTPGNAITLSSIPGTYNQLVLYVVARFSDSATTEPMGMQFNGDTGSNYDWEQVLGNNVSAYGGSQSAGTYINLQAVNAASATASVPGTRLITIPFYTSTTFYKMGGFDIDAFFTLGTVGTYYTGRESYVWRSTAAITSATLYDTNGGNFVAGSSVSIYGIN